MGILRNTGVFIIGVMLFGATILLGAISLVGITWLTNVLSPLIVFIYGLTMRSCLFVLLPLSLFKTTRTFAATGFAASAMIVAINVWLYSVLIVDHLWGFWGLVAGIILGVIGIVPLAVIATASHGLWSMTGWISVEIALYLGLYVLGIYLRSTIKSPPWTAPAPPAPAPGP
jgi:hypothetical protein